MFIFSTYNITNNYLSRIRGFIFGNLFLSVFLCLFSYSNAQPIGNEWIDFAKTYHKFPVTHFFPPIPSGTPNNQINKADYNGLRRITKATLDAISLGNTPAEDFQLWRNGEEIPIYITQPSGLLSNSDYIEFWGEANDGKPDKPLFRNPTYQINDRWSFFSDTASFYLTVNTGGNNARIKDTLNLPLTSPLTPDAYFMHTIRVNYRQFRYLGYGVEISGKSVRSSSFDIGEGWGRVLYRDGSSASATLNPTNLYAYTAGPLITLKYAIAGETGLNRFISTSIVNGASDSMVDNKRFVRYTAAEYTVSGIPYSRLSTNALQDNYIKFSFPNGPYDGNDRVYILRTDLTYARTFNFSGTSSFLFNLPANPSGNLFDVTATGIAAGFTPYILDLTNQKKYTAVKKASPADTWAFELGPSALVRKLVFVAGNSINSNYREIIDTIIKPVRFTNYSLPDKQADYIIISNSRLFNSNGINYVDKYKEHRSSASGGNFNAKVFDIDSLTDQFAYGIRKSPLAIRNFLRYANSNFSTPVKYIFLIGHGTTYDAYGGINLSSANLEALNLVPTWGHPASDNMLAASSSNFFATPLTPIGRISVVNGEEVKDYLDKVKEYELLQSLPEGTAWQKNALHLIGGSDANIVNQMKGYMDNYKLKLEDTLAGANVKTYVRISDPNTSANNAAIQKQVSEGTGLVTYFGHSSPTSLDFNLNDPYELSNTGGKYPVFLFNGCNASEFFTNTPERIAGNGKTLSEKFITAKERGTIAFMSSSHFGVLQYLDVLNKEWYKAAGKTRYGKGVGDILKEAITTAYYAVSAADYYQRLTLEEFILHADPAVKLFTIFKPDYEIDSSSISFSPSHVTMATDSLTITTTIINHGKALGDSVWFELNRTLPDGGVVRLYKRKLPALKFSNSISVKIPIVGIKEKGLNIFRAVVDSVNLIDETDETNNGGQQSIFIYDNEVKPLLPYQYSIAHQLPIKFIGSTVNPQAETIDYRFQIDTSETFSSPFLYSEDLTTNGNIVEINPVLALPDSTVYYWRISPITAGIANNWQNASFVYLSGSSDGFNQSHYYQHLASTYSNIIIDSASRTFCFDSTQNNIYVNHGIYKTSGTEDSHFSITLNGTMDIFSACLGHSIIFNVFDSLSFKPWSNVLGNGYGSANYCGNGRNYNFEFSYYPASERKKMMDFIDSIPKGMFVAARMVLDPDTSRNASNNIVQLAFPLGRTDSAYSAYWLRDTAIFGTGKSLYHALLKQGFYTIDQLNSSRTFAFVFKKDDSSGFKPQTTLSAGLYDRVNVNVDLPMLDTSGLITSPLFGPAAQWQELHWRGKELTQPFVDDGSSDSVTIRIYGLKNGVEILVKGLKKWEQDVSIADIDANEYPYLRLQMVNNDPYKGTPQQLDYWRLNYEPIPEGAIAPARYFDFTRDKITLAIKDTLEGVTDTLQFGVAFQNISNSNFTDSIAVQARVIDSLGKSVNIPLSRLKPLVASDTLHLFFNGLTDTLDGSYNLWVNFNPNKIQKEQTTENNFMYKSFFVDAAPEGLADSATYFEFTRSQFTNEIIDTLLAGFDNLKFGIAFKNISPKPFADSIGVSLQLQRDGFGAVNIPYQKLKPLAPGAAQQVNFDSASILMQGWYTISVLFNPGKQAREKTIANNYFSRRFYVKTIVLPVSIIGFTAIKQNSDVLISWTAEQEQNFDWYVVEYSKDGIQFNSLEKMASRHSSIASNYQLLHGSPAAGFNYYRLKIVNKDGSVQYSVVRQVYFSKGFSVQVMPNPFKDKLRIFVSANSNETAISASLLNAKGQILRKFTLQNFTEINTSALPAGTYWLLVHNGEEKKQVKIEKQ